MSIKRQKYNHLFHWSFYCSTLCDRVCRIWKWKIHPLKWVMWWYVLVCFRLLCQIYSTNDTLSLKTNGEHEMFFAERLTETSSVNLRWNGISVWTKPQKSYCRRSKEAAQILRSSKAIHLFWIWFSFETFILVSGSVNSGELLAVMGPR